MIETRPQKNGIFAELVARFVGLRTHNPSVLAVTRANLPEEIERQKELQKFLKSNPKVGELTPTDGVYMYTRGSNARLMLGILPEISAWISSDDALVQFALVQCGIVNLRDCLVRPNEYDSHIIYKNQGIGGFHDRLTPDKFVDGNRIFWTNKPVGYEDAVVENLERGTQPRAMWNRFSNCVLQNVPIVP